ncbi:putative ubiquitin-conjugating enzyme E2 25 [Raphanus sativus]|uniref:E2 ubiquitin-conjugating enzyme n=1 Tax=Raphanus sativus TaxID=3726 RepID=A0A6J0JZ52_RAPSA|nr:probable ubiquitin-conjugating enzyme E2 25 [Raphanus sativus]KAJ4886536.1 putative ubiquitin-conjugating enzyme E2 25 [Raphanus sativus]
MEPEIASCSQTLTPNQETTPEANGVEQYEGVVNNNTVDNKNKGKAIQLGDEDEGSASDCYDTTNNDESYPGSSPLSNSLLDPDSLIYEDDDDYSDQYGYEMEDELEEEDDYVSEYQAIFDAKEKDIPAGVEVAMDWLPNTEAGKSGKCSRDEHGIKPEAPSSSSKKATTGSGIHSAPPVAQPWNALPHNAKGVIPNSAYALPLKSQTYHYSAAQAFKFSSSSGQLEPQTPDTVMGEAPVVLATAPSGLGLPVPNNPSWYKGHKMYPHARPRVEEVIAGQSSSRVKRNMEDYLGKYLFFKKFDIVEDLGDHEYAAQGTTVKQHSKEWMKRIQEEWRILENDLPEMIFVRAYESRMDLMRAVIVGADGTPYHDGLFFFDIFFPDTYPSVPPMVHYQSGGLRINPNLYNCGKVCLSLLGTWSGAPKEKWIPNNSTMLQVLVSIQGLILNEKPYFNEPGYERTAGSAGGEAQSKAYSENTFLLSLKTMVYNMRRPPKYFEDFSYGHFFSCAHDVLRACTAYRNGAPVASLVRGKVKEGEENSEKCSEKFSQDVGNIVDTLLLKEFILLGVLGLEPEEEGKPSDTNVAESSNRPPS